MKGDSSATGSDFVVFGAPQIQEEEIEAVCATLRSGWIGTGPRVAQFEEEICAYKQCSSAAAVSSCTAAMHLSMLAAGIGPGDEVITTAMTFCATTNAIIHAGATPVLVDVDPSTMNIDPAAVEAAITPKTKGILPVHFAGRCCDMDALMSLVERHNLLMIEDCAHAVESEYHGKKAGTFGDFGCLSFYVTKNVTTAEGGMVLAKDKEHIDQIKILALHGMSKDAWSRYSDKGYRHYFVTTAGFKFNMTDIQASLGIHQLKRVQNNWERRQVIWNRYQDAFKDLPITLPADPEPDTVHAYHLYTILIGDEAPLSRDEFLDASTKNGIGTGVHYMSIPEHPFYQESFGWKPEMFPNAMRIGRQTVSLPLSAKISDDEVERVIASTISLLTKA